MMLFVTTIDNVAKTPNIENNTYIIIITSLKLINWFHNMLCKFREKERALVQDPNLSKSRNTYSKANF